MRDEVVIEASGLSKRYTLGSGGQPHNTLRDILAEGVRELMIRRSDRPRPDAFWALKDASFQINRGENVGIIGLNGAGKSTLLKILSRITEPTSGYAKMAGRVGALLEVGTGFHGELTGRENVYLYGAILGMSRVEIAEKFDAIIEFAGIHDFVNTPVKRYSSGMYVRLAFAVAAHLEPEILLLDEVLSVGDLPFQRKCIAFAKSLQQRDATILFVSHNMFSIKSMCQRVIYLRKGQIVFDGPTEEGIALYEMDCQLSTPHWAGSKLADYPIVLTRCELLDDDLQVRTVFDHGERMRVRLYYEVRNPIEDPNFIVAFIRSDDVASCNYCTETDGVALGRLSTTGIVELRTPPLKLVAERYIIHVLVRSKGTQDLIGAQIGGAFHVRHPLLDKHFGVFHEPAEWESRAGRGEQLADAPSFKDEVTE